MQPFPNLDHLNTFLAVADARSFSEAAVRLDLAQPTVSQAVRRLEDWAGRALIDRSTRPLTLTMAGQDLRNEAPALIAAASALGARIRDGGVARRDRLRIGMPDSLSEIMGAEILGAISPLAGQVALKSGISPWLETAFHDRTLDMAVDMAPLQDRKGVAARALFDDPYVLALPPGAQPDRMREILRSQPMVGYGRTSKFGAECTAIAARLDYDREPRFSFDSTQSLLRFVQAGYGWAVTSAFCLFQSPQALETVVILPCPESAPRRFSLLYRTDEGADLAEGVARGFRRVFAALSEGPWHRLAPRTAAMIRAANGDHASRP
jgi:DNA-binding transcriptional LysR family regulator